ncbi:UNVERIFIED_CONTAM: hypothetical protein GTU68_008920, partial [Idotea baltica]|nr:hypothetical protein [Idotea baltica]
KNYASSSGSWGASLSKVHHLFPVPSTSCCISKSDLQELFLQLPRPFLVLGDFNSRSPLWGDVRRSFMATAIEALLSDMSIHVMNTGERTYYHVQTDTSTCIDLSLCSSDAMLDFSWRVLKDDHGSDHFPVIISLPLKEQTNGTTQSPRWMFSSANWMFHNLTKITQSLDEFLDVDEAVSFFNELLLSASKSAIPLSSPSPLHKIVPWWSDKCREAVALKKKATRRYQRKKSMANRVELQRCKALCRKTLKEEQRASFRRYVSAINKRTPVAKVWERVGRITRKFSYPRQPVLNIDGEKLF